MAITAKCYLLSFDIQRDEIDKYCFDECKKILFGCWKELEIKPGKIMTFMLCKSDECPFLKNQSDEPLASDEESDYYLRALKSEDDDGHHR